MRSNLPPDQLAAILKQTEAPAPSTSDIPIPRGSPPSSFGPLPGYVTVTNFDLTIGQWFIVCLKMGVALWLVALLLSVPSYLLYAMLFLSAATHH